MPQKATHNERVSVDYSLLFYYFNTGERIMNKYYAGCDTHKDQHFFSIIDVSGEVLESFEIENNLLGWNKAHTTFQKYPQIICGIENSGNYGKHLAAFFLEKNVQIKEVNPVFTGLKRKAHTCYDKTDLIDSVVIARITRDEIKYLPDIKINAAQEDLKLIIRQRGELVKERTKLVNRLHAKLTQFMPGYKKMFGNLNAQKTLRLIEQSLKMENTLHWLILQDINLLKNLIKNIKELEKMLEQREKSNILIQNLTTLTGINTISACSLISIVGDISYFKNSDKLAAFAGIAPVKKESGKYSRVYRNKGGNRRLNSIIYRIALTQICRDEEGTKYYEKKIKDGKTKKQALHFLMRKLVRIIFMMYKHNKPYEYKNIKEIQTQDIQAA